MTNYKPANLTPDTPPSCRPANPTSPLLCPLNLQSALCFTSHLFFKILLNLENIGLKNAHKSVYELAQLWAAASYPLLNLSAASVF